MSTTVLARKYRPRNFEALVGQTHVVQALVNALTQKRLHHAWLFTGTRQLILGVVAAAVTFGVGHLFGSAVS